MQIVFMGTPDFAVPALLALAEEHQVVCVYTRPDAASGRGRALRPTPVKVAAEAAGLPVRQPTSLLDDAEQAFMRSLSADLCVVAAYGAILPPAVLEAFRLGCVNIHASLLPSWRGAAPIQRAILAGDDIVGVSIMRMEAGLDTGPYCATARTAVGGKDSGQLTEELALMGAELLLRTLPSIESETCAWTQQDASTASYAAKLAKSDVALDPSLAVLDALRRIRASSPAAPARARIAGVGVTILTAENAPEKTVAPGLIDCDRSGLLIGLADGALSVTSIKPDGKSPMDGPSWARGLRSETSEWEGIL